ncbi:hypothetical protein THAOC_13609, partial [Thalassiosira oceanica]
GRKLARWLGTARNYGDALTYWVMPESGVPVTRSSVEHVTTDDLRSPEIKGMVDHFNSALTDRLKDDRHRIEGPFDENGVKVHRLNDVDDPAETDQAYGDNTPTDDDYGEGIEPAKNADDIDAQSILDPYLNAKVILNHDPENSMYLGTRDMPADKLGTVVRRKSDPITGETGGPNADNPAIDDTEYEVLMPDGTEQTFRANAIAENLWQQCDAEGNEFTVIREIINHRFDETAIRIGDEKATVTGPDGDERPAMTTKGLQLEVELNNDATIWVPMADLKYSNPVELAEYAYNNDLLDEPVFKWWAPKWLWERHRIVKKAVPKYWRKWKSSIEKEMCKIDSMEVFEPIEGITPEQARKSVAPLIGYQEIKCHMIFDVKMDGTCKSRFVAGGHTTETPASLTYSSVVSRESVRTIFTIASLNDLKVLSCDIGNAYLNAPCKERIWFVAGPECGKHKGKVCKLKRALYGLKSSGASWREMFSNFIQEKLNFKPTTMDPDVYIRRATRADRTGDYYEYLLVYVDDVLVFSERPQETMDIIAGEFTLKDKPSEPDIFLGAGMKKIPSPDGEREYWSMDSEKFISNAVETVSKILAEDGRELLPKRMKKNRRFNSPLHVNYKPELDKTPECNEDEASRYRQLIGILRWSAELGRIDILYEVSIMSQYQANPRKGHLEALYSIFCYLQANPVRRLVFNPQRISKENCIFNDGADWTPFYGDVVEESPPRMPDPLGPAVQLSCYVDASHANNVVTRRSHTGINLFLMSTPVISHCKRQNTCEAATFGSELVAMRIARDLIIAYRLKLRSFGVRIDGPADVHCDNQGVCCNTMYPESTLSKKHNAINYHVVREAVAMGAMRVCKEDTETNNADALTKLLPFDKKRELLGFLQIE